jgi:hypothetical protein
VTIRRRAAQRVVLRLLGRPRRPFVIETRDASRATLRQRVRR